jgi:hypothetical protein
VHLDARRLAPGTCALEDPLPAQSAWLPALRQVQAAGVLQCGMKHSSVCNTAVTQQLQVHVMGQGLNHTFLPCAGHMHLRCGLPMWQGITA